MNKISIIKQIPINSTVLNCNVCYDKGLRNINIFKIYEFKGYRYYVCMKCDSVHKVKKP